MNLNSPGFCRECNALTSGRCAKHVTEAVLVGTYEPLYPFVQPSAASPSWPAAAQEEIARLNVLLAAETRNAQAVAKKLDCGIGPRRAAQPGIAAGANCETTGMCFACFREARLDDAKKIRVALGNVADEHLVGWGQIASYVRELRAQRDAAQARVAAMRDRLVLFVDNEGPYQFLASDLAAFVADVPMQQTLRWFPDHLQEWTDFDCASYALAEALGLVETWGHNSPISHKGVFWSANPVGDGLTRILRQLVEMGVLEVNEEGQYRVRAEFEFDGDWDRQIEEDVAAGRLDRFADEEKK